jgi:hypothetical protein
MHSYIASEVEKVFPLSARDPDNSVYCSTHFSQQTDGLDGLESEAIGLKGKQQSK